ncbi:MAG: hypothetical protein A2487_15145 [Candidatus Raymondbacteria bacterium RifOxyC12_full_50_8]|uniref:Uncharacterized protein n=1 Tax=Candidatus Raymondbacteria bacterium RIFOXYD12_FULL_49_13 TaxID=1817890 RepID=A0A1F7FJJ7_UNCRA|nr:MAG: hypothetical protein A2350_10540 [Candidatus Raymondbacteria bacterium RifOxyB12_full_50_8]OGJ91974.1 MAG: hypothetical protein A2248_09370 [Candidatus Raymondbacteria bacterium RIFOXYA2_FULL_49_16]OGJ96358.1 MAG: hypothetical protein A2453_08520 [Candidatus Raymondbacteria bacterium RIFOXYC2_FULL_50_21]OGK03707.1 MAG: hypothetical protein A2487_15145 [Candidatus Raymondbacteria bacterium RifOxyC12_full_50_8]OGK06895.1 MAG: hypothetical protein A2519_11590 [Candidatus Raymondbacteria ba
MVTHSPFGSLTRLEPAVESTRDILGDSLQLLLVPHVLIMLSDAIASVSLKNRGPNYPCFDRDPPMHSMMKGIMKTSVTAAEISAMPNPFNPAVRIA